MAISISAGVGQHPTGGDVALEGDRVAGLPQLAHQRGAAAAADAVHARGAPPRVGPLGGPVKPSSASNSSRAHSALPCAARSAPMRLRTLDEHLDVEGGVAQPRLGQRPGGPVDGGVLLGQATARGSARRRRRGRPGAGPSRRPPSSVSNSCRGRRPTSARQARSWVAACRIHSASPIASSTGERSGQRDRVDQPGARALAAELHEVGALAVAVAGGPLGVDGDRPLAGGDGPGRLQQARSSTTTSGHARRPACRAGVTGRRRRRCRGSRPRVGGSAGSGARSPVNLPGCAATVSAAGPGRAMTPSGSGGRPGDRAEQVGPGQQVRADAPAERGPRGADLHLDAGAAGRPGRRSSRRPRGSPCRPRRCSPGAAGVQGVGQPGPADRAEHRVGGQLGLELGAGEGHRAPHAVPRARGATGRAAARSGRRPARRRRRAAPTTSAVRATAYGAMRWGAGTSVRRTSGRSRAARRSLSACVNSGDWSPGTVRLATTSRVCREGASAGRGATPARAARDRYACVRMLSLLALGLQRVLWGTSDFFAGLRSRTPAGRRRWSAGHRGWPCSSSDAARRCTAADLGARRAGLPWSVAAGLAGSAGLVCFYAALRGRDDGRRRADRRARGGRPGPARRRRAASSPRPWAWVGMAGRRRRESPWPPGPSSPARSPPRPVAAGLRRRRGFRARAVLPRPRVARVSLLHTLWGMRLTSVTRLRRRRRWCCARLGGRGSDATCRLSSPSAVGDLAANAPVRLRLVARAGEHRQRARLALPGGHRAARRGSLLDERLARIQHVGVALGAGRRRRHRPLTSGTAAAPWKDSPRDSR